MKLKFDVYLKIKDLRINLKLQKKTKIQENFY